MNKNDEKLIEEFLENKNISKDSKKRYNVALKGFQKFIKKDFIEFIKEIKNEQMSFIRKTERIDEFGEKEIVDALIEPDIENGKLARTFRDFYSHENERGLSDVSINSYISDVRAFLKKQGIKLPEKVEISTFTNPKKKLKQEKIKRAIEKTPHLRNKAMFAFMASSGLRSKDVRNLKIKDFLKAVKIRTIKELLLNQDNLMGYWEFKPSKTKKRKYNSKTKIEQGYVCKTCNTPYATNLIIEYLKKRNEKENFTNESHLFVTLTTKKKMGRQSVITLFKRLDKELYNDDLNWFKTQLELGKITEEEYKEEINDVAQFHAHGLRAFFINTISSHCSNLKVATAMEGHKSPVDTDNSYTNFKKSVIENHYRPIIPYLTFEKIETVLDNEFKKELDKKEKIIKEQNKKITQLESGLETVKEDVEILKDPNKYYSPYGLIEPLVERDEEITPEMFRLMLEKIDKDDNEIYAEGKDEKYVDELLAHAKNTLNLNPDYFTQEKIENLEIDDKVFDLFSNFVIESFEPLRLYLREKNIILDERQNIILINFYMEYLEEIFYYEDKKIDEKYVKSLIMKIINNEIPDTYISPNNPEMNKNKEYLKGNI